MGGVRGVYEWPSSRHHWFQPSSNCCPQVAGGSTASSVPSSSAPPSTQFLLFRFFFLPFQPAKRRRRVSLAGVRTCVWVTPIDALFLATPPPRGGSPFFWYTVVFIFFFLSLLKKPPAGEGRPAGKKEPRYRPPSSCFCLWPSCVVLAVVDRKTSDSSAPTLGRTC